MSLKPKSFLGLIPGNSAHAPPPAQYPIENYGFILCKTPYFFGRILENEYCSIIKEIALFLIGFSAWLINKLSFK